MQVKLGFRKQALAEMLMAYNSSKKCKTSSPKGLKIKSAMQ